MIYPEEGSLRIDVRDLPDVGERVWRATLRRSDDPAHVARIEGRELFGDRYEGTCFERLGILLTGGGQGLSVRRVHGAEVARPAFPASIGGSARGAM